MKNAQLLIDLFSIVSAFMLTANIAAASATKTIEGVVCETPPVAHCDAECSDAMFASQGNAIEPKTGRKFFLDYPCDLKKNEKVVFILNLHGAGTTGNWQRQYFPAMDYKEKYRLVVATPTAATLGFVGPVPGVRIWVADADDEYLSNLVDYVFEQFGRKNIKTFWLAGHSQGGVTANRLVCNEFFTNKVDGWLSLSGGRIGAVEISAYLNVIRPAIADSNAPQPGAAVTPTCDISYIFASGEHEIVYLPETSPWADKYKCRARVRQPDTVDERAGYVSGNTASDNTASRLNAAPGTAQMFIYHHCEGHKVVADVVRLSKGHTEGLEPKVTEALVKMMTAAPGGKARKSR